MSAELHGRVRRNRHLLLDRQIRCVSMDGGGLYGLTQAIWLRMMCEANPDFLRPREDEVYLFVGTSAGAVNALLLAQKEDPRAFVMSRQLEQFWKEPGFFTNRKDPTSWFLSNLMLTPWLGTEDAFDQLLRWFGERRMVDLHHLVIVSTYNWAGGRPTFPPLTEQRQGFTPRAEHWLPRGAMLGLPGVGHRWQPYFFNNFLCRADAEYLLADVAFGATAMPSVRAIRGGIGDGGIFNANPSMDTIALLMHARELVEDGDGSTDGSDDTSPERSFTDGGDLHPAPRVGMAQHTANLSDTLSRLHMLSLGNGAVMPYYHTKNCGYGALPWNLTAVNTAFGPFRPNSYMLNQALQEAEMDASSMLATHFFRFNPGVMMMPPGPVLYFVRNDRTRDWFIRKIEENVQHGSTHSVLRLAHRFLNNGWTLPIAGASQPNEAPPQPRNK